MNKRLMTALIVATLLVASTSVLFYLYSTTESTPDTSTQTKTCTTYGGRAEEQCVEDYIGLTEDEAITKAKAHGYLPKIAYVDGVDQIVTDFGGHIIYFVIDEGVITDAYFE